MAGMGELEIISADYSFIDYMLDCILTILSQVDEM